MIKVNLPGLIEVMQNSKKSPTLIGIVGQAGAGKTTVCEKIESELGKEKVMVVRFDWFFKLSRKERKAWIEEEEKKHPQKWIARDQINWWDFEKAWKVLEGVKNGREILLKNVYNRADNGELTGEVLIQPKPIVLVEGVPVILLGSLCDHYIYIHAEPEIRKERLWGRDPRKGIEALKRWIVTQRFELREYKRPRLKLIDIFLNNSINYDSEIPSVLPAVAPGEVFQSLERQKKELQGLLKKIYGK